MYDIENLNKKKVTELREIAETLKIEKTEKLKKQELVYKILDEQALKPVEKKEETIKSEPSNQPKRVNPTSNSTVKKPNTHRNNNHKKPENNRPKEVSSENKVSEEKNKENTRENTFK
jgi:transcription termination factor Rho